MLSRQPEQGLDLPEADAALEACDRVIQDYLDKGRRYRNLSLATTLTTVLASALVPVSIVISSETGAFAFGKLLPSLLAAGAAVAGAIAGLARPYERWRGYRKWAERLAVERLSYCHRIGDYASDDRDNVLVERVIAVRSGFDGERQDLIPSETQRALAAAEKRVASG